MEEDKNINRGEVDGIDSIKDNLGNQEPNGDRILGSILEEINGSENVEVSKSGNVEASKSDNVETQMSESEEASKSGNVEGNEVTPNENGNNNGTKECAHSGFPYNEDAGEKTYDLGQRIKDAGRGAPDGAV
ncbi:hypothetical protein J6Z48_00025 [bacterium]|nr:hypothetical protein [bacterium]